MWQPPGGDEEPEHRRDGLLEACSGLLATLLRCLCCLEPTGSDGDGGQRLLGAHQEPSATIEAPGGSPPRLPAAASAPAAVPPGGQGGPPLKGQPSSRSSSLNPTASPPMPLPFFSAAPPRSERRGSGGSSPAAGGSPTAGAKAERGGKAASQLSLLENEDICPTCLDPYSEDNPKVLTRCGHHFHLPCLYEWLERSETCPVCAAPMHFEEII